MRKKKILMMLALLLTAVTGAWADEVKTVLDDGVFTGFTATGGAGGTGDGGYAKLVDGNTSTKWCTDSSPFYIEFHSSGLIVPTGYIMTTGGDTQSYSSRNPKSWTIKAKVDANDNWTELVSVTDDATMPASNYTPVEFTISGNTTAYKYFRLDVSATRGDSWFQLSEFQFMGTTTDTGNFTVNPSLSGSGTSESPYTIGSTADWDLFASKVNSGTNNYSGKYVKLTANITVSETVGQRDGNPFSGIFLGDGHTITANISSTTTGTGANEQGVAPFHYINGATIKDLTVAGTIASASYHTSGLVGFAEGTNLIENCTATATLNISSNYAGGVIGHGMSSTTTIKGCVFAGTINGVDGNRENIGGIWGWGTSSPVLENCLEKGTYTNITSMHPMGLQKAAGTITGCYYVTPQIGSPSNACTVSGATQVFTAAPAGEVSRRMTLQDGNDYYGVCTVSGLRSKYMYTGSPITVTPTVICGSTTLAEGTDYTYATSPATVQEMGDYTLTVTGQGDTYTGAKTIQFAVIDKIPVTSDMTTLTDDVYVVNDDVTISSRIQISGDVFLVLGDGTTLTAPKGIELSEGNSLTIEGPGTLTIDGCDGKKSGIGATRVGTLTINGGTINVNGGTSSAGIGGSCDNSTGGTIIINGGVVNANGGSWGAGIGGGYDDLEYNDNFGYCGNITINGGQVTAKGGSSSGVTVPGIGPGVNGPYNVGSLTIGWTNATDFVNCTVNLDNVSFADGKFFVFDGTKTLATPSTFSGKKIIGFVMPDMSGAGTEGDPYIISTDDQWVRFAYNVNNGTNYNNEFVSLTDDISVTMMVGASSWDNSFQGTFLGGGHTLTFTQGSANAAFGEDNCAPFRFVKNATIQNLKVAGDIYTSKKFAAGLASRPYGTTNITNCVVSTNIYSSVSNSENNDGTHGGFVAMPDGTLNIAGCAYTGHLLTNNSTTNCGGIVGWHNSATISVTNTLYAPSGSIPEDWTAINAGATFVRGGSPTITGCYYTEPMGDAQGALAVVLASAPTTLGSLKTNYGMVTAYENAILLDGKYYIDITTAAEVNISLADNADNSTTISTNDGKVANVTLQGRTLYADGDWNTLCLPFDVTLSSSPLARAVARPISEASISESTLSLTFGSAVTTLQAGTPYIIKWPADAFTFTATSGTGTGDGGYDKLVDGKTDTKWCQNGGPNGPWTCEFRTSAPVGVTGYTLTTGGDTYTYQKRNPLKWTLEAKADESDAWTTIDSRDVTANSGDALPTDNTTESQVYAIASDKQGQYQYFRFTVIQSNDTWMQLSELSLKGTYADIVSPVFSAVTIDKTDRSYDNNASGSQRVRFIGTYGPLALTPGDKSILFMGNGNTLYYPLEGASINAQRAYFKIGEDGAASARQLAAFHINFGDDSEATGIVSITPDPSPNGEGSIYTLDGRRLNTMPTKRGIYVVNGKKVVIK